MSLFTVFMHRGIDTRPTATPTNTPGATPSQTPTQTPTQTCTPTQTMTPTVTPTNTPTVTPTVTPASLPAGVAIWLDASNSASVLDAAGNPCALDAPVATWLDLSTNNRHFAQDTSSFRPTLTSYQGMNYIKFTSANATALLGNANALTFSNGAAGVTLFAVTQFGNANVASATVSETIFANTIGTGAGVSSRIKFMSNPATVGNPFDRGWFFSSGGRRLDENANDGGAPFALATATQKNVLAPGVMSSMIDYAGVFSTTSPISGTVSIFFNGAPAGSDPAFQTAGTVSPTDATRAGIGRRFINSTPYYHNGVIAEFVAYDRILSPAEFAQVNAYLMGKWSIAPQPTPSPTPSQTPTQAPATPTPTPTQAPAAPTPTPTITLTPNTPTPTPTEMLQPQQPNLPPIVATDTNNFLSMVCGNNILLGGFHGKYIRSSTDNGANWSTGVALPNIPGVDYNNQSFSAMYFVGGRFFASVSTGVGQTSTPYLYTSTDGTNWSYSKLNNSLFGSYIQDIEGGGMAYGNGLYLYIPSYYIGVTAKYCFTSADGTNWTENILTSPVTNGAVCFDTAINKFLLMCGGNNLYESANGASWTLRKSGVTNSGSNNKLFAANTPGTLYTWSRNGTAVSSGNTLCKSTDSGLNWTATGVAYPGLGYYGAVYNNRIYISSAGTFNAADYRLFYTNNDGASWITQPYLAPTVFAYNSVTNKIIVHTVDGGSNAPGSFVNVYNFTPV